MTPDANEMNSTPGKLSNTYALIRDKDNRPVIDDGDSMPLYARVDLLTPTEQEELANDRFAFRRNA